MPLTGIRVLDLSRVLPGPFASQLLADFGAEVIKVEDIDGDPNRKPASALIGDENALFFAVNRNKKSMALDLRQEEGKTILKKLILHSDILIENFVPGTMSKLGLDYGVLKAIQPRLIYCALSAFGTTGPLQKTPAHDLNILGFSGITHMTGKKDDHPIINPLQTAANTGSLYAVIAMLLALRYRQKTGQGQFCDISMLDGAISLLAFPLAAWSGEGRLPERGNGAIAGGYAYYQIYATKDGQYMSLCASEPKFWNIFCQRLQIPHFITWHKNPDPALQQEMISAIGKIIRQKTQQEWLEVFGDENLCFTPVLDLEAMSVHPQVVEREMVVRLEDFSDSGKELKLAGLPIKLSDSPGQVKTNFPQLGQHTQELLTEAGFSLEEIRSLNEKKVIR